MSWTKRIAFVVPAVVLSIAWLGLLMLAFTIKADSVTEPTSEPQLSGASLPARTAQGGSPRSSTTEYPVTMSSPDSTSLPPAGAPFSSVLTAPAVRDAAATPAAQETALTLDANLPAPEPTPPDAGIPVEEPKATSAPAGVPDSPPAGVPTDQVPSQPYYP